MTETPSDTDPKKKKKKRDDDPDRKKKKKDKKKKKVRKSFMLPMVCKMVCLVCILIMVSYFNRKTCT